jgi:hypothetical protein
VTSVRVQDFILKTRVDYIDEHSKDRLKASTVDSSSSSSSSANNVQVQDQDMEEADTNEPPTPPGTSEPQRTKYHRQSKPVGSGALKEKEIPLAKIDNKPSATTTSKSTSKRKDMSKVRQRYRGYNLHGLSLNCIETDDPEYRAHLTAAVRYPSFFQPFAAEDLFLRNPGITSQIPNSPHVQLLLGQKSSVTPFHQEAVNSHGFLILLSGTKRWFFKYPEANGKCTSTHVQLQVQLH